MTSLPQLPHRLDRTVIIQAPRDLVFEFFTQDDRWAAWWGSGSTIDPRPGGQVYIRYPGGVEVSGEVIEAIAPERLVFTYGFVSGKPIPAGSSRVTIRLAPHRDGTALSLSHEFTDAAARDEHIQGWRYQLSVFGNLVADRVHAGADRLVDRWFEAWAEADAERRERTLASIAAPDVKFRDRFSLVDGLADLSPHIAAAQRFMAGVRLERVGDVRHCQGTVLADWVAQAEDGQPRGRGSSVFVLDVDRRISSVTGFWAMPEPSSRALETPQTPVE